MDNNNLTPAKWSLTERVQEFISQHWQPKPIDPPKADPNVEKLTGAQRSAEVIRYSILSIEFWLSPLGRLREWVRLNGKLSAILLVPALLVLPLITFILYQIAHWLILLISIAGHLIVFPLVGLLAVGAITGTVILLRAIFGR